MYATRLPVKRDNQLISEIAFSRLNVSNQADTQTAKNT